MSGLAEFLDMGGYGAFVWPSYAITMLALGTLAWVSLRGMRKREAEIAALERENPEQTR